MKLKTKIENFLWIAGQVVGYIISFVAMYLGCSVGMKLAKAIHFWCIFRGL